MSQPAQPGRRESGRSDDLVRVLVIHDEILFRTGIRALIATHPSVDVVADCASVAEATGLDVDPDVVLAASTIFGVSDTTGAASVRERLANVPILVVGPPDDFALVRAVIAAGVTGYMTTRCHPDELVQALRSVAGGGAYLEPSIGVAFARSDAERQESAAQLSEAEREVLQWIALGYTNREIATRRGTSARSVESLRAGIVRKLGFGDRASLVRFARSSGLGDDEPSGCVEA